MRGYLVVLLACLASIQLIDAARRSSGSRSSSSSSRSSSSRRTNSGGTSTYSGGSQSGGTRNTQTGGTRNSGGSQSGGTRNSGGSQSGGTRNSGSSGSSGGRVNQNRGTSNSKSRSNNVATNNNKYSNHKYNNKPNHGYGSNYGGYGSNSHMGGTGYSYKSPGYGTKWGTSFSKTGRNTHYSKKALGLGVGAGFVGGAIVGGAATYAVYHRYNAYRDLTYRHRYGYGIGGGPYHDDFGWGSGRYYNDYYLRDECRWACPGVAVCRYGFCECPYGYTRKWGRCSRDWSRDPYRPKRDFDPLSAKCANNEMCFAYDFNLICNLNVSTTAGRCECRTDMRWNAPEYECQLYLDVDCSSITYDTKVDPIILEAVNKTEERIENDESINLLVAGNETDPSIFNETAPSREETLKTSLLESIDPKKASEDQIREAYCRDVDSLSHEFQKGGALDNRNNNGMGGGSIAGIVIFILLAIAGCCCCAVCCAKKSKKKGSRAPSPVAFSAVQDHEEMQNQPGYPTQAVQPGYPTQAAQPGYPAATQAAQPGYPAATQAYQPTNQPGYTPIYPPVNQ